MNNKILLPLFLLLFSTAQQSEAQLKFILEDFEGLANGQTDLKKEGLFAYGSAKTAGEQKTTTGSGYSGERALKIEWNGKDHFGGWGKGIGLNIELDVQQDYFNFYVHNPESNNRSNNIKIILQEDDNDNSIFEKDNDDSWYTTTKLENKDEWQLISIPLLEFKDENNGGDGKFNISYKEGKLFTFIINFADTVPPITNGSIWYFDFISFSKGRLPTGLSLFDPPSAGKNDFCSLGAWSEEGNTGNFIEIAGNFENIFKNGSNKKLEVVHFFQPFSSEGGQSKNLYPSTDKINLIISKGYIPMITIENHYVKVNKNQRQPNLYSIIEGHFDYLFSEWAKRIKQVNGIVLLRILHEFNGDWYPWCIANNDKNSQLYIKAYHHIWNIFNEQKVTNIKFIWCPNSMSSPQASWNFIMDAYPGDKYVDYVALDVYNGAGEKSIPLWRSFRKEAIENYFQLTENLPHKPLLICETSSRERKDNERGNLQDKGEWIAQMSEALQTDLSKVRLITWFNEYDAFKVNSSANSQKAFLKDIWMSNYFKLSSGELFPKK